MTVYLVYKPEGQPEQRWHYQPGRFRVPEMRLVEKTTGMRWKEFQGELEMGSIVALQALLWTFQRRQHPTLKVEDVDFAADEVELVKDADELAADLQTLEEAAGSMPERDREAGIAYTRLQMRTAPPAPGKAPAATPAEPPSAPVDASTPQVDPAVSTS
jgi:hypothetical protein